MPVGEETVKGLVAFWTYADIHSDTNEANEPVFIHEFDFKMVIFRIITSKKSGDKRQDMNRIIVNKALSKPKRTAIRAPDGSEMGPKAVLRYFLKGMEIKALKLNQRRPAIPSSPVGSVDSNETLCKSKLSESSHTSRKRSNIVGSELAYKNYLSRTSKQKAKEANSFEYFFDWRENTKKDKVKLLNSNGILKCYQMLYPSFDSKAAIELKEEIIVEKDTEPVAAVTKAEEVKHVQMDALNINLFIWIGNIFGMIYWDYLPNHVYICFVWVCITLVCFEDEIE